MVWQPSGGLPRYEYESSLFAKEERKRLRRVDLSTIWFGRSELAEAHTYIYIYMSMWIMTQFAIINYSPLKSAAESLQIRVGLNAAIECLVQGRRTPTRSDQSSPGNYSYLRPCIYN